MADEKMEINLGKAIPKKGVDYWTEADKQEIIRAVVDELSAVVVTIDENNAITINGDLEDGTYTVRYLNADGNTTSIGTLIVGDGGGEIVLSGLTVSYDNTTAVAAGTTLSALDEVVRAVYSDGTKTGVLTKGTDYELSGTLTAGQTNTITVVGKGTYAGLTSVTFRVTVAAEITYTNILSTALEPVTAAESVADVVWNDVGYQNGAYASSAYPYYGADSSCFCVGALAYNAGDIIYVKGATLEGSNHERLCVLNKDTGTGSARFAKPFSALPDGCTVTKLADSYYQIDINDYLSANSLTSAWIIFSARGTADNLIVTRNEGIA